MTPLLTLEVLDKMLRARREGSSVVQCSLDLERSITSVDIGAHAWTWNGQRFPYPGRLRERTIYHWSDDEFRPVARFASSLVKLVPTHWGPPTFEIDGIKMLASEHLSPYEDAERKVKLVEPRGKVILDTCGGLGYFAEWCLREHAARILSFEKNPDVIWLRGLNPWSPGAADTLTLTQLDITAAVATLADQSVDAVLHDPPRFSIAGELYAQAFYGQLARVLKRGGKLFHYTGSPHRVSKGRDLASEVAQRLRYAGFDAEKYGDGLVAVRR